MPLDILVFLKKNNELKNTQTESQNQVFVMSSLLYFDGLIVAAQHGSLGRD